VDSFTAVTPWFYVLDTSPTSSNGNTLLLIDALHGTAFTTTAANTDFNGYY
jgi:hypothetical protein